jgi:hypothetical protein
MAQEQKKQNTYTLIPSRPSFSLVASLSLAFFFVDLNFKKNTRACLFF